MFRIRLDWDDWTGTFNPVIYNYDSGILQPFDENSNEIEFFLENITKEESSENQDFVTGHQCKKISLHSIDLMTTS